MDNHTFFSERYSQMQGSLKPIRIPRCIRTNTQKISSEELYTRLTKRGVHLKKIPFLTNGFSIHSPRFNLVSTPEYLLGLFYIQDAATQLPAELLKPHSVTLDGFAAPGGKTTHLACYAPVIAIENNLQRLDKLHNNLERLGIQNCITYHMDFLELQQHFSSILLDVPCSGNYMLEPNWITKNSLTRIQERAQTQKQYLTHALNLLKPKGTLIYCTCSLEPEENEMVLQHALNTHPISLEPINTIGDPGLTHFEKHQFHDSMKHCRRLWPAKTNTIGFFIARMTKHA